MTAVAPLRDVQPQSLPKMISLLTEWEARCGEVITDLEAEIARIKTDAAKRHAKEQSHQILLEEALQRQAASPLEDAGVTAGLRSRGGKPGLNAGRRGAGSGGNKREADDFDEDDGFFEAGDGGAESGSRMDIDEGAGSRAGSSSRHSKRVLGRMS